MAYIVCIFLALRFFTLNFKNIKEFLLGGIRFAICSICGDPATRTQRLIDNKPANYDDPIILVSAQEKYEARCRHCHQVPGRPNE